MLYPNHNHYTFSLKKSQKAKKVKPNEAKKVPTQKNSAKKTNAKRGLKKTLD